MALLTTDPDAPEFTRRHVNLADARLGALALDCSDDFFADRQRMLAPQPAVFVPGKYDANGKWMDGWESRRKRGPGHDWCVVRLARSGVVHGVDLDTSHFTGNFPPAASIEACFVAQGDPDASTIWASLLPAVNLHGNRHHYIEVTDAARVSHLRVNLFPDGGLARLRVYGTPDFPTQPDADGLFDLIAALNGGTVVAANNQHFGLASTLLQPGRGVDMGDGWETRRRREPGNDWCVIALARPGTIESIEVDTAHFRGNFPDRCSLRGAMAPDGTAESLVTQAMFWPLLLPEQSLRMDHQHHYRSEILAHAPVSHVRFDIHPDGGISRLRLRGRPGVSESPTLTVEPLDGGAFAAFGDVIEAASAKQVYAINEGTAQRHHDLAQIDCAAEGGRTLLSLFRAEPRALPFEVSAMERHPLGSQAFVPLDPATRYLVVVSEGIDAAPRAFLATHGRGINLHRGVWHHALLALDRRSDFLVIDRGGPGANCDEIVLSRRWRLAPL